MKKLQLLMLIGLAALMSCNSKNYPANNLPEDQLIFGSGGGFTGEVKQYILLKNGQMFRTTSFSDEIVEIDKVSEDTASAYFEKAENLSDVDFNFPGNRYYFITRRFAGSEYKIVWGNSKHNVPKYVEDLYNSLNQLIQTNN